MLTYGLTCAFVLLLAVYYLVLKQKSLIRTLLKYRDLNPITLIEVVGSEVTAHLPRHKTSSTSDPIKYQAQDKLVKPVVKDIYQIPGPVILPVIGTRWQYYFRYNLPKVHEAYIDMHKRYGDIVLEVGNGHPYLHLFDRNDIDKVSTVEDPCVPYVIIIILILQVMRCHSKYPFRPPIDIVIEYRKTRPDRYASYGLVQE